MRTFLLMRIVLVTIRFRMSGANPGLHTDDGLEQQQGTRSRAGAGRGHGRCCGDTVRVWRGQPPPGRAAAGRAGAGGGCTAAGLPPPPPRPLSAAAVAGEALFNDKSLSASGQQSCATCHVKSRAFTADPAVDKGLSVPLGGRNMDEPGFRNAPSLMYAAFTPAFSINAAGTAHGGF